MDRTHSSAGTTSRPLLVLLLALALATPLVQASPLEAQEPVEEVRTLCVYKMERVHWGIDPSACKSSDTVFELPGDYPLTMCVEVGEKIYMPEEDGSCPDRDQVHFTVPDDGPMIMCAKDRKNGLRDKDRAEVVYELSPLDCDPPKYYSPYVTPTPPVAVADAYTTDEDTLLVVPAGGVLENDTDYNPGTVEVHQLTQPAIGTVALQADGSFSYDPRGLFDHLDVDESQEVTFTYNISDGELISDDATVTLTITGVNDAPVANPDSYSTDEDTTLFIVPPGVLGNDTDAEGHDLTAHIVDDVATGALALGADGSVSFDPGGAFEGLDTGESASVNFTYVARDGSADSPAATVDITVEGVNDAPEAEDDLFTTDENTVLTIPTADLLANDSDVDGESITATDIGIGNPSSSFTVNGTHSITFDPRTDFDYLRDGQTGVATITYRAFDGDDVSERATVRVEISGLSTPEAQDDFAETDQNNPVAIDILANDTVPAAGADVVGVTLMTTRGSFSFNEATGLMEYDPDGQFDYLAPGQNAKDRFGYRLVNAEGESRTAVVTVIVYGTNDAPTAMADTRANGAAFNIDPGGVTDVAGASGVLVNDHDVDPPDHPSGQLTATLIAPPERGRLTLHGDGGFSFNAAGEVTAEGDVVTFRYRATDGLGESSTALVELVVGLNPAPVFTDDTLAHTVYQNTPAGSIFGTVVATDSGGETVTFALADNPHFLIDATTGELRLSGAPPAPDSSPYVVQVTATDEQGQSTTADVTIQSLVQFDPTPESYDVVGNVPLRAGASAPAVATDLVIQVGSGVLANDGAQDGTVVVDNPGTHVTALGGQVEIQADGEFVYRPPRPTLASDGCEVVASGWDGTTPAADSFTYDARDTLEAGSTTTVAVTLNLTDVVWIVDSAAGGTGCGTAEDPYGSLGSLDTTNADGPGHLIYLRGDGRPSYTDGVSLKDGQRLQGEGVALSAGGHPLLPVGPAPVVAPDPGEAIVLAADNTLHGFSVDAGDRAIVSSGPLGTAVIDLPSVEAGSSALRLLHGGTLQATIPTISGGERTISLSGIGGTLTATQMDVTASADAGVFVNDGTAAITIDGVSITGGPRYGVLLQGGDGNVIDIASLTSDAGEVNVLSSSGSADIISIGTLTTTGGAGYVSAVDSSQVVLNAVDITVGPYPGGNSFGIAGLYGSTSSIEVRTGTIRAAGGFDDALIEFDEFGGTADIGADVLNGSPDDAAGSVAGRAISVSQLTGSASYTQGGDVVGRGDGVLITANAAASTVLIEGDLDVATDGTSALRVDNSPVALTGPGSRVSSTGADAVHMTAVDVGDEGVLLAQVDATAGGITLADVAPSGGGVVEMVTGSLTEGAISITDSAQITLGSISVTDPPATGITLDGTTGVRLEATQVIRAFGTGISSTDDDGLVIFGATIESPGDSGIDVVNAINGPDVQANITDAAGEVMHLTDDGSNGPNTAQLNGLAGTGGSARVPGLLVEATGTADLTVGGSQALIGGRVNAVDVSATGGGDVALETGQLNLSGADVAPAPTLPTPAMMKLHADGAGSTVTFDLALIQMVGQVKGHGLQAFATGGGRVGSDLGGSPTSRIGEITVVAPEGIGVHLEDVDGVRFDKASVQAAGTTGIAVWNSANVRITNVTLKGAFGIPATEEGEDPTNPGNAIDLWGSRDVIVRQGMIDMSDIDPFDPFLFVFPQPSEQDKVDEEQTRLEEACGDVTGEVVSGSGATHPGQVGVFGRHLSGDIEVANLEIEGGSHSHVILFNGDGVFRDDKTDRPTPDAAGPVTFTIGGLSSYVNQYGHFGAFVGGHDLPANQVAVDFSSQTSRGDGRTQVCASDTEIAATGGPVYISDAVTPALSFSTPVGGPGDVDVDLDGFAMTYNPAILTPEETTVAEDWGALGFLNNVYSASLSNGSVADTPGPGLQVPPETSITDVTVADALGDGVQAFSGSSLTVDGLHVSDVTEDGIHVVGYSSVFLTNSSVSGADRGLATDLIAGCLDAPNNTFSATTADIDLEDLTGLKDYGIDDDPPDFVEDEQYWFATRNGNTFTTLDGAGHGFSC